MYPYFLFAAIHHLKSSPTFSVRPLIRRSWVRFPPRSKDFFFASCGSLIPFTRANAQWVYSWFKQHFNLHFRVNSLFLYKSTQVEWRPLTYYWPMKHRVCRVYLWGNLRVRSASQRQSLHKFNLRPLPTTCRSVWPGLYVSLVGCLLVVLLVCWTIGRLLLVC